MTPETPPQVSGFRKWLPLVVLAMALAIIIIDTTILNVSLRTIIGDLHTDIRSIQWVVTAYALMLAAFTITGGRLGDLFGRKKMFVVGAVIFAVGSFITSISHHVGLLVIGEAIIEGIGAVLMLPATASLLLSNYQGRDRAVAFGIWGGIAAASAALGPVVGGWLTTHYSWRWAFRINIVVALLLIIGSWVIKEARSNDKKPSLDIVGVILSSLGLLSIVYGFIEASNYGWWKAKEQLVLLGHTLNLGSFSVTPIFVALGLIILGFFIAWQKHRMTQGKTPLVSLDLFRNREFVTGSLITAIMSIGMAGLSFSIPVFLQGVRNLDPLHTGIAMLPMPLAILVSAPLSAFIVKFIQPKRLVQIALLITIAGFIVMRQALGVDASVWSLAPGFAIFGFGMGLMFAQLSNLTLSAVSVQESGEASGVNNTFRQLGQTLGSAILGAILISSLGSNLISGVQASPVIPEQAKPAISQTVNEQASNIEFGENSAALESIPATIKQELTKITHSATTDASRDVTVYGAGFMFLALLSSFFLVGKKKPAEEQPVESESVASTNAAAVANAKPVSLKKAGIVAVGAVVVLGAAAGTAGYYAGQQNAETKVVLTQAPAAPNNSSDDTAWTPLFNPTVPPTSIQSAPSGSDDSGVVAGAETSVPQGSPQTYTSPDLKFTMDMPTGWEIEPKGTEVVVSLPTGEVYSLQSYFVNNNDTDGLKAFLSRQSNIHNPVAVNFNGYSAFHFAMDGTYSAGYAFLSNGRLYYVLGTNLNNSDLASFRAI
jgi:EmrB/QacA subfamily drug resistance transporter